MNAEELMNKVIASGANENGIRDRFGTNAELYALCFREFLEEPNLEILEKAIASKDYAEAFEAAHALKGVSGNLGLTAFFDAVSILVESLRSENYTNVSSEYANVLIQINKLKEKFSENKSKSADSVSTSLPKAKEDKKKFIIANNIEIITILLLILSTIISGTYFISRVIPLHIMHFTSDTSVDNLSSAFSDRSLFFFVAVISMLVGFVLTVFIIVYWGRKKSYDKALLVRDRLLNLMIENTKTAFALFNTSHSKPDYCSANTLDIVGDTYWHLYKTDSGYRVRNNTNTETNTIVAANEMLRGWDGKSAFRSGYLCDDQEKNSLYFMFHLYPVDDMGKEYVGIVQDVTLTHEREMDAKKAMEMAERASEAKSRFLSYISHDIRTPMNAIINMSSFSLENIDKPKKLATYLHTIHDSAEHLLHLINDVLDMSRIESGQTVISPEDFDLFDEVQKQVKIISPLCDDKKIQLLVNTDGIKTSALYGDSLKLAQIIMNLLSNAVKFTPERGAIRLTVAEIASLASDTVDIRIKVEDTGIGISESNLLHIFEPFKRADDKRVNRIEGTGLGLSICKNYVDAMGGSIKCESEEGEGTTFTVELFFSKSDISKKKLPDKEAVNPIQFLGMRCLVIDDNATNRLIANELLERLGFIVDFSDNGRDGVDKFVQSNTDTYDVIYMDIQMPGMDGYHAAEAIRASAHARAKTIPIIAMTANAFKEDIEKALLYGMDAYIDKPIVPADIIEQTDKAIKKQKGCK